MDGAMSNRINSTKQFMQVFRSINCLRRNFAVFHQSSPSVKFHVADVTPFTLCNNLSQPSLRKLVAGPFEELFHAEKQEVLGSDGKV